MRQGRGEILGNRLPHVGERRTNAEIRAARIQARRVREDREILARMVRGRIHRIGIAAMIRGDHQKIRRPQSIEKRPEQCVEFLERCKSQQEKAECH